MLSLVLCACGESELARDGGGPDSGQDAAPPRDAFVVPVDAARGAGLRVVTFNTGTTDGLRHDDPPDDGYGSAQALISDTYYGNGLSWPRAIEDTRAFLAALDADILVFQELFHSPECETIPSEGRAGFVCERYVSGDPTVAQTILGSDYQVACHLDKPDKCAAVHRRVGTFRGCDSDLCLDGLQGARVMDCGGGSRVGRGVIDLVGGGSLTLVSMHGSSGAALSDQGCRVAQLRQVFEDLGTGDGAGANGSVNLIMGDFNTDPFRLGVLDQSARFLEERIAESSGFHALTAWPEEHPRTYAARVDIDHVISDRLSGTCFAAGITPGTRGPTEMIYFDHRPIVCDLDPLP